MNEDASAMDATTAVNDSTWDGGQRLNMGRRKQGERSRNGPQTGARDR